MTSPRYAPLTLTQAALTRAEHLQECGEDVMNESFMSGIFAELIHAYACGWQDDIRDHLS